MSQSLPPTSPIPQFEVGDELFIVKLDTLYAGIITDRYLCGHDKYYGYRVDLEKGGGTTTWDYEVGSCTFHTRSDAEMMRQKNYSQALKIDPNKLSLKEHQSFRYVRPSDSYQMTANIAKIGDNQLIYKTNYTYTFLHIYPTSKQRDREYKKLLKTMKEDGEQTSPLPFDKLYFCNKTTFASLEYAMGRGYPTRDQTFVNGVQQMLQRAAALAAEHNEQTSSPTHNHSKGVMNRD